ncbi:MAG: PfkB family carbohydrate kinase [Propionibacteriaceae bacterium]|jgi:fructoselysine 6-kinase|nr:PfkB family carbohydrate kinase [Propionibacteriaceae bacterium]
MRIVAIGDNCLDWYLDRQKIYPGGNTVNVAVFTHRLGAEAAYIGQFGADRAGDIMISALRAEGVDCGRIRQVPGRSGYATVRNIDGERVFQGGSNGVVVFAPDADDLAHMAGADLIHTGDCSFLEDYVAEFAAIAPVSFDFSIRPDDYCQPLLPHVKIASFSRPGLAAADIQDFIAWAHSFGPEQVHVTQGENGSWVSQGQGIHHEPSVPTQVCDTLGAGDSFISAMLIGRLQGKPLDQAAAFAARFAAKACQGYGAFGYEADAADMTVAPDHYAHVS